MHIVRNSALSDFVDAALMNQQSPDAIAGRLATGLEGLPTVSADSIYRYIASVHGRKIEYARALIRKQTKARKRKPKGERLSERKSIDDRPSVITNRERVGDVEADFIVSGKTGSGYLLTVVDRKIRVGFIRKLLPVSIVNMERALLDVKAQFPELLSVTTDNDILFRSHERLEQLLGVPIYFCDPYSSWQKGSIENLNKQVRKYIPKGADISQYNEEYIQFVQVRLNSRFMSVTSYQTPAECLSEHRAQATKETSRSRGTVMGRSA
jgi:IS30 family transposase